MDLALAIIGGAVFGGGGAYAVRLKRPIILFFVITVPFLCLGFELNRHLLLAAVAAVATAMVANRACPRKPPMALFC